MRITLDVPDETRCLNVCIVYQEGFPAMAMAATMRGSEDLRDGAVFHIPGREGENNEQSNEE